MTSYQLLQAWLPIIAIILISLYQLLIYLSLISASTSLSLCQHFIFHLCQHFIFHLRGQNGCHDQNQREILHGQHLYWTLQDIHCILQDIHCILQEVYCILQSEFQFGLRINKVSFSAKVKHGHKRISKVSFVHVYSASYIG